MADAHKTTGSIDNLLEEAKTEFKNNFAKITIPKEFK
jgi:hypothetical protein